MTELEFRDTIEAVGKALDVTGVAVIVGGIIVATIVNASSLRRGEAREQYRRYRQGIGRAIHFGLEVLVGADIIRTVAVDPTFECRRSGNHRRNPHRLELHPRGGARGPLALAAAGGRSCR